MSATTKKKHVAKEVLEEYPLPDGNRQIVKVTASRGNNLHEVVNSNDEKFLVSMPSKFRKHVWIKRGDFIMVEPIQEGDKVKGEISHILFKDQIKHIQEEGLWPKEFSEKVSKPDSATVPDDMLPPSDSEDSDNDLADMVVNMNRVQIAYVPSDSEEECSDSEDAEEDGEENEDSKCYSSDNNLLNPSSEKGVVSDATSDNLTNDKETENSTRDAG